MNNFVIKWRKNLIFVIKKLLNTYFRTQIEFNVY